MIACWVSVIVLVGPLPQLDRPRKQSFACSAESGEAAALSDEGECSEDSENVLAEALPVAASVQPIMPPRASRTKKRDGWVMLDSGQVVWPGDRWRQCPPQAAFRRALLLYPKRR